MHSCSLLKGIFPTQGSLTQGFTFPALASAGRFFSTSTTWEAPVAKACMCAKSPKSCPAPCNPRDHSLPGSSVHGILQARVLEQVTTSSSKDSSRPRDRTHVSYGSCIAGRFFTTSTNKPSLLVSPTKAYPTTNIYLYCYGYTKAHKRAI